MKREKLKNILSNYFSIDGVKSIMSGRRKPSYKIMLELYEKHRIPFTAWKDISLYIVNDTPIKDNIKRVEG